METPILVASISFVAAVVAVIVGQLLSQRFQRTADERRWARKDSARRRAHSEELAREAIELLNDLSDRLILASGVGDPQRMESSRPGVEAWLSVDEIRPVISRLRRVAIEIDDPDVRRFLGQAVDVLAAAQWLWEFGGSPSSIAVTHARDAANRVVGAFLRGEPIPQPDGDFDFDYVALQKFRRRILEPPEEADSVPEPQYR